VGGVSAALQIGFWAEHAFILLAAVENHSLFWNDDARVCLIAGESTALMAW